MSDLSGLLVSLVMAGLVAGLAAGLFGVGGGAIIVPVLYFLLSGLGYESTAMHVALATSLATITLTSCRSVAAHHTVGAVDWLVIRSWGIYIFSGAGAGMVLAAFVPGYYLTAFFGVMAVPLAAQLFFGRPDWHLAPALPSGLVRATLGLLTGGLSALMGIGGGTFGVTLMTLCGHPIHRAVATAAGFGVLIGLPAAVAGLVSGLGQEGLPPGSVGYVNVPAFVLISSCTVFAAPYGARLAHLLPGGKLKKLFGVLLALVGVRMLMKTFAG